jgi:hypothetical protein
VRETTRNSQSLSSLSTTCRRSWNYNLNLNTNLRLGQILRLFRQSMLESEAWQVYLIVTPIDDVEKLPRMTNDRSNSMPLDQRLSTSLIS